MEKEYCVKVRLQNLYQDFYYENLTLEEARAKVTEQQNLNIGRNPEIMKMEDRK